MKKTLIVALLLLLFVAACQKAESQNETPQAESTAALEKEKPFVLSLQEGKNSGVSSAGMKVKLTDIEDSRCALGVQCI